MVGIACLHGLRCSLAPIIPINPPLLRVSPNCPAGHARKAVVAGGGFKGKKKAAGGGGAVSSIFGGLEMFSGGYDFGFNDTP